MKMKINENVLSGILCTLTCAGIFLFILSLVGRARAAKQEQEVASGWESNSTQDVYRVQVPTGWLVRYSNSICFVPDPAHDWVLK